MENRNHGDFGKPSLARLQARRILSDYADWYQLIVRGIIFSVPMAVVFIVALIFGRIEDEE